MWYHISRAKWDKDFIDDLRAPAEDRSLGESRDPRLSVAPTVCQALLGVPEYHGELPVLHIYAVAVDAPEAATVGDTSITGEHCITQQVMDRHNGKIPVTYEGYTIWSPEMRVCINHAIHTSVMTDDATLEKAKLWDVVEENWIPKFKEPGDIQEKLAE